MSNIGTIAQLKEFAEVLHTELDALPNEHLTSLQIGVTVIKDGLTKEQLKTLVRKYQEALGSFADDATAALHFSPAPYADPSAVQGLVASVQSKLIKKPEAPVEQAVSNE